MVNAVIPSVKSSLNVYSLSDVESFAEFGGVQMTAGADRPCRT
jgi:hypothetical protein